MARLHAALEAARAGRGSTIIVAGEAGIGKTRLIGRFADEARARRATVLEGACLDVGDGALPYGPFVEILRELVRSTEVGRLPALIGPARGELGRLLPELEVRGPIGAAGTIGAAGPLPVASGGEFDPRAQARLFELVLGVVERLAREAPVVAIVEDVQWADQATLDLLSFLSRSLRDDPALLVVSARTDELARDDRALSAIAELERDVAERIDVPPFSRQELAEQMSSILGSVAEPDAVERIAARSDGNPFFTELLVEAGSGNGDGVPARVRDVLAAQLAGLSTASLDVLRVAAAAGRSVDDELVASALELTPRQVAGSLREAVARGVLIGHESPDGRTFAFRHALLQAHVAGELFSAERAALHGSFARALEARAARGDRPVAAAELARHWDAAQIPGPAYRATIAAAREAESVLAFADALRLWERAIALRPGLPAGEAPVEPVDELEQQAAESAVLSGEYARAVAHGRAAVAAIDAAVDPVAAGQAHDRLRWYLWESGDRAAAAAAVREALRLLPAEPPSTTFARALAQLAGIELFASEYDAAIEHAIEAIRVARACGVTGEEALALGILGWATAVTGAVDTGLARFAEAQAIAEALDSVEGMALGASNLAWLLDRLGRPEAALAAAMHGLETVTRLGVARTYGGLLAGFAAKSLLALGRWDEAERLTSDVLGSGATGRAALWLLINRARVLLGRGRFEEAADALVRAREIDTRIGESEFRTPLLAARVELAVWSERQEEAREVATEALRHARPDGPPDPSLAWLAALALRAEADLAARARARRDGAALAACLAVGEALGAALDRGVAVAGELVRGPGRGAALVALIDAERSRLAGSTEPDAWAVVAEAWAGAGRPFPSAYARFRQAEAILASRGARAAAEAAAREAHATAVRLGALPLRSEIERLARQARLELAVTTAGDAARRTPSDDPTAAYGFTEREAEVLRLVAGGWSNQQIADELYITRKTASVHVSNILGKLGVDSRVEAAAIAHRLGVGRDAPPPPDTLG